MKYSLPNSHDFQRVFRQGKKFNQGHFSIFYLENSFNAPRLGLIIAKKHIAHATNRNRMKRMLREGFRLTELPAVDIVVLLRSKLAKPVKEYPLNEFLNLWKKLNTLYEKPASQ